MVIDCPEMVVMPAGAFTMGSPKDEPDRRPDEEQVFVRFAKPFAVGRFAVTRGEFAAFVAATNRHMEAGCRIWTGKERKDTPDRSWQSTGIAQTDRHPVVCVNWNDANAYVAWLSKRAGKTYRLLSEAEREYAARAGTTTPYWWGPTIDPQQANAAFGKAGSGTLPVDSFAANPWGLYNVHGNVMEWVADCWNESNVGNPGNGEPRLTGDCGFRVIRNHGWYVTAKFSRSAARQKTAPSVRGYGLGFRVARTLD